jgi:hypothetical protein
MPEFRENEFLDRQAACVRRSRETEHESAVVHAGHGAGKHRGAADLLV